MAVLTTVTPDQAHTFLLDYDLGELHTIAGVPLGTVNSNYAVGVGGAAGSGHAVRVFLRIYEEQDLAGARREAELLAYLATRGVVTPTPIRRRDGSRVGSLAGKPAALFPWCEGEARCLQRVSPRDTERLGEALGRLHAAGVHAPVMPGRFEPESLRPRLAHIARGADRALAALAPLLDRALDAWSARRDPTLPRGLIHGDLFRDNVLWDARGNITSLLDFESASTGAFAYDVMVTLLAWCVRDDLEPGLARAFVKGYRTVRDLSDAERSGLLAEGCIAALRFTITRITDDALRALETGGPPRRDKDWRRFAMRRARLEALGDVGLRRLLDL